MKLPSLSEQINIVLGSKSKWSKVMKSYFLVISCVPDVTCLSKLLPSMCKEENLRHSVPII